MGTQGYFPREVRRQQRENDYLPPCNTEVKNGVAVTSTPPIRLHNAMQDELNQQTILSFLLPMTCIIQLYGYLYTPKYLFKQQNACLCFYVT